MDGLLAFAKKAFGAETVGRHADPAGIVRHAVMKLEGSAIELGEAHGEFPVIPAMLYVYVADVDRSYERALAAGGESLSPRPTSPTATAPRRSATLLGISGTSRGRSFGRRQ